MVLFTDLNVIQQSGGVQFDLVLVLIDKECILTEEYCIVDHFSIKKVFKLSQL